MPDNITLPGTSSVVATDEVGVNNYQRIKLTDGLADSEDHLRVRTSNPLASDGGAVVRQAPCEVWTVGFARVGSSLLEPEMTQRRAGTGVTVTQAASNLLIVAGTTINSEYLARSIQSFRGSLIARHRAVLSQRIINNNFAYILADRIGEGVTCTINSATSITVAVPGHAFTADNVGQFMNVGAISAAAAGVPGRYAIASVVAATSINFTVAGWPTTGSCVLDLFGWNYIQTVYNVAFVTNAHADAQRRGWNSGNTLITTHTTATPGHILQTHADGRNIYWSDSLAASSATPTFVARGNRVEHIPDDDVELFYYLWSFNGTIAPASSTTWTVGFLAVEDLSNHAIYIAGARPQGSAAPLSVSFPVAQSVTFPTAQAVTATLGAGTSLAGDVGQQYRANATGAASGSHLVSAATTNATIVKAAAGRVVGWSFSNSSASWRYVKLHNISTTPTAGAGVVRTIGVAPGGVSSFKLEGGIAFTVGIGLTAVTGSADADATAVSVGDIVGDLFFA